MIQLRPYQLDGVKSIRESFRTNQRVLFVAPTGSGKSALFAYIVAKAVEKGSTVLVLSHRIEIFRQNLKAISNHNVKSCLIDADNKRIDGTAKLFFGMVESFKRRIKLFEDIKIDLIVVDEGHLQTYFRIFNAFPNVKVLSVTASPVGKKLHLYYNALVQSIGIPELIEQGFLCPCLGYEMRDDFSDLKTDNSGEFTEQSNFEHFNKAKLYDGCVTSYLEKCKGLKTIVFCINIIHAEQTTKAFKVAGISAHCITSNTSEEQREWILNEFRAGNCVLVNANIFLAGFDEPSIECVIFNRATNSLINWLQGCGRASRPFPGKTYFKVIDLGGNHSRLGLWAQERNWELSAPKKKKKSLGAAPIRECKNCFAMLPAQQKKCNFCGYEMTDKEKELLQGQLVEVKDEKIIPKIPEKLIGLNLSECSIADLIDLEKSKALNSTFVWKVLRSRGETDVISYANMKGYKSGWIQRQISDLDAEFQATGALKKIDFKIHENLSTVKK